jgi:hypothetical protein
MMDVPSGDTEFVQINGAKNAFFRCDFHDLAERAVLHGLSDPKALVHIGIYRRFIQGVSVQSMVSGLAHFPNMNQKTNQSRKPS